MNNLLTLTFLFLSINLQAAVSDHDALRSKIGPTLNSPTEYNGELYFLATTGILYKSDYKISKVEQLFKTKTTTITDILINNNKVYFGEGLHSTKKSFLYEFDLASKKITNKIELEGHIEKKPTIFSNTIYVGSGPGGFHAIDLSTFKIKWSLTKSNKNELHVDSTPVIYKDQVCFTSIYKYKAIVCASLLGKIDFAIEQTLSPKGDISLWKNYLYGFSTDADMNSMEFKKESNFYSIDLDKKKIQATKNLRGYNFFSPLQMKDEKLMINISTGDILYLNVLTGGIGYIADFPEPFVSSPFKIENSFCSIGIMGKLVCYEEKKDKFIMSKDQRFFDTVVGSVGKSINGKIYLPSRIGFLIL